MLSDMCQDRQVFVGVEINAHLKWKHGEFIARFAIQPSVSIVHARLSMSSGCLR